MLELFLAELRRTWIQFKRYPFEAVGGIFIMTSVFYGLFLGARYVAGTGFGMGDRFEAVVVGYVLWSLVLFILSTIAIELQSEAQTGTLEQVFLSPFRAWIIFATRAIASLTIQAILIAVILGIISLLTGTRLNFSPSLLPPLITTLMGAYGISFMAGSLSLLFKRVQQLLTIFQFGLLFVLSTPLETWDGPLKLLGQALPMTSGAGLLRDVMARDLRLDSQALVLSLLNGAVYLSLGLLIFQWCERQAKKRGKLSGY
ncbi:MAG: ABC transporter permease [Cyanobacteria bacterium J06641_5]